MLFMFSHDVYQRIRTRVIVVHEGNLLMLSPHEPGAGWQLLGGGLEMNESLANCARREVFEETGLAVQITNIAFLRDARQRGGRLLDGSLPVRPTDK